jgi:hypothetical protein
MIIHQPSHDATSYASGINALVSALGDGWTVSWGLDGKVNNPTTAAAQAEIIAANLTSNPIVFSSGNEPDLWSRVTEAEWGTQWNVYYTDITDDLPSANFETPETATTSNMASYLGSLDLTTSTLTYVTTHYYYGGGGEGIRCDFDCIRPLS